MIGRRLQIGPDQTGDAVRDLPRVALREVRQHHHRNPRVREPQDVRRKPLQMSAVFVVHVPSLLADEPPEAVGEGLAAVERHGPEHVVPHRGRQERAGMDRGIPFRQIDHRGNQPAVAGGALRLGEVFLVLEQARVQPVAGRAEGQQVVVAVDVGVAHVQAREYPRAQEIAVGLSADPVDDHPEHDVGGVAVVPTHARGEFRGQLHRQAHEFILGVFAPGIERLAGIVVVGDARGVGQQVAQGDFCPRRRGFGQMAADGVVERELAVLREQEHGHRDELLGQRGDLVDAFGQRGGAQLDVGQAVALGEDEFVVDRHRQRQARDALGAHLGAHVGVDVGLRRVGLGLILRGGGARVPRPQENDRGGHAHGRGSSHETHHAGTFGRERPALNPRRRFSIVGFCCMLVRMASVPAPLSGPSPRSWAALAAVGCAMGLVAAMHVHAGNQIRRDLGWFKGAPEAGNLSSVALEKLSGIAVQAEAFREPTMLPVYGSSELTQPQPNRPDDFFRLRPTGFDVFPIAYPGETDLVIATKLAALGSLAHGRQAVAGSARI